MEPDIAEIAARFRIDGRFIDAAPYGAGHINRTFVSRVQTSSGVVRFVHQRINHDIFKRPEELMSNIERVTAHIRDKHIAAGRDPARRVLTVVPALDGGSFLRTGDGGYWRTYLFVEDAHTCDVAESPDHAYSAAKAFAEFQLMVGDLPGERLYETIPHFGDSARRFGALVEAVEKDAAGRAAEVTGEIDFALAREDFTPVLGDLLAGGRVPERIIHYDTKINNVLIDDRTGEGICVIDLDTVMPGVAMYDFGDMVRLGAATAAEDEPDPGKVHLDLEMFESLVRGYLQTAAGFLTSVEIDHLAFSARLIAFTIGMRFLTDHLAGDVYYRTHRPGHNLDRCRTQFAMVRDMEARADEMASIVNKYR